MALYDIEKYDDFLTFSSDHVGKLDQGRDELSCDCKKAIHMFLEEFSQVITLLNWDYIAIEFWFDAGHLYLFPEKIVDKTIDFTNLGATERLDPYFTLCLTSYLKKFDAFIEDDYGKFSENELEAWHFENCKEVFGSINLALSDSTFSNFILNALNRKQIVFRYFGTSREIEYGEKTIAMTE